MKGDRDSQHNPGSQALRDHAKQFLANLTDREREVLRQRFGIDPDRDVLPEDIEPHFSDTARRILAIEAKALRKLDKRKPPDDGEY